MAATEEAMMPVDVYHKHQKVQGATEMDIDQDPAPVARERDLYSQLKNMQRQLEFLEIQVGSNPEDQFP